MELAKKPVRFLCNADAVTFRIAVPKTERHYLFYRNQPYLIKFDLDIEFFDEHLMFDRVDDPEPDVSEEVDNDTPEENLENSDANEEESPGDATQEEANEPEENPELSLEDYKKKLQNMKKSDVRKILKELAPEKSCPIRKENIIKEILKLQEGK